MKVNSQSMTHSSAFALLVHQAYQTLLAVFCLCWKFLVTILHSWLLQLHLASRCHWKALFLLHPLPSSILANSGRTTATVWLVIQHILPSIFISILFLFSISLFPGERSFPLSGPAVQIPVSFLFTSISVLPLPLCHCYVLTILVMNPTTPSNLGL